MKNNRTKGGPHASATSRTRRQVGASLSVFTCPVSTVAGRFLRRLANSTRQVWMYPLGNVVQHTSARVPRVPPKNSRYMPTSRASSVPFQSSCELKPSRWPNKQQLLPSFESRAVPPVKRSFPVVYRDRRPTIAQSCLLCLFSKKER